jgi:hypothetical protein
MSSTVFSISLNELDMAKLGELQKKFPELTRNGMIRRIISVMHLEEDLIHKSTIERVHKQMSEFIFQGTTEWTKGKYEEAYWAWCDRRNKK